MSIQTKIGEINFIPNGHNHIYVEGKAVTIRGKTGYISAHYYKWSDDEWHLGLEKESEWQRTRSAYVSDGFSVAWRDKALETITPATQAWAKVNAAEVKAASDKEIVEGIEHRLEQIAAHNEAIAALGREITLMRDGITVPRWSDIKSYTFSVNKNQ